MHSIDPAARAASIYLSVYKHKCTTAACCHMLPVRVMGLMAAVSTHLPA